MKSDFKPRPGSATSRFLTVSRHGTLSLRSAVALGAAAQPQRGSAWSLDISDDGAVAKRAPRGGALELAVDFQSTVPMAQDGPRRVATPERRARSFIPQILLAVLNLMPIQQRPVFLLGGP